MKSPIFSCTKYIKEAFRPPKWGAFRHFSGVYDHLGKKRQIPFHVYLCQGYLILGGTNPVCGIHTHSCKLMLTGRNAVFQISCL